MPLPPDLAYMILSVSKYFQWKNETRMIMQHLNRLSSKYMFAVHKYYLKNVSLQEVNKYIQGNSIDTLCSFDYLLIHLQRKYYLSVIHSPLESLFSLFFYFYFILLYNTVLVLPYIDMNPPWVFKCMLLLLSRFSHV